MADLWYPGGIHDPAPGDSWGTFTDTGEPKFLLHTTEGSLGAYSPDPRTGPGRTYYGNTGTWPNYTLAIRAGRWRIFNHIPANRSAQGLVNAAGGVQTNRDNVNQVEIATRSVAIGSLPAAAMDELARLLAWQHTVRGVPLRSTVRWVAYPASYGSGAGQRLPASAWDAYAGVLGHQHCPENDHGDPGAFPVAALLRKAADIVSGDDVTEQDKNDIANKVLAALRTQVFSVSPPIRQPSPGAVIGATYNKVGQVQEALSALSAKVDTTGAHAALAALWDEARTAPDPDLAESSLGAMLATSYLRANDVATRLDFVYDQLTKIAEANHVTLDPAPWREPAA